MVVRDWTTITGPLAWCPQCSRAYHGDADPTTHKAMRWARDHVRATKHSVIVERGQSMIIDPDPEPSA